MMTRPGFLWRSQEERENGCSVKMGNNGQVERCWRSISLWFCRVLRGIRVFFYHWSMIFYNFYNWFIMIYMFLRLLHSKFGSLLFFGDRDMISRTVFSIPQAVTPSAVKGCVQLYCWTLRSIIYRKITTTWNYVSKILLSVFYCSFLSGPPTQRNESIVRVSINFGGLDKDHKNTGC